ncbi:putative pterin-4-alpha-carbinolamine dehydratase [Piscinibacter gummiphilus]|nr:putative pterin-4-alpha-carbinolamine dehydratase [Piscinibacter gummiphilus]
MQQHCQHQSGAAMSDTQVHDHLAQLSSWKSTGGAIEKAFTFKNFHETMAFVNALAWIAHTEDHHPDLQVGYDRCTVRFSTHSVGGISVNDFICAAKADALVSFVA